jgi:hypothetical protein
MKELTELKPCLKCGSGDLNIYETEFTQPRIHCQSCHGDFQLSSSRKELIEWWNTRALPVTMPLMPLDEKKVEECLIIAHGDRYDGVMPHDSKRIKEIYTKAICSKFGQSPAVNLPSEDELWSIINSNTDAIHEMSDGKLMSLVNPKKLATAIHARLGGKEK